MASRRLLLISYWYPPSIGAAAERMHGFARYLAADGWRVEVLTAQGASPPPADPGVTVHVVKDPLAPSAATFPDYDPRHRAPAWKTILREFWFPDRFRAWAKLASERGCEVARAVRPDIMLASFPPASAVTAALSVREASGAPLVFDFRDLWLGPGGYEPRRQHTRNKHDELQRRAASTAAALVAVSEAMADRLAREHCFPRERIAVVPNGYDPHPPLRPWQGPLNADPLCITHVGTVIARNRPELFLQCVRQLARAGKLERTRFRFVGNLSRDYLRDEGLEAVVETTGLVSRERAREEMESATALLLLVGKYVGTWGNNAKLFEYVQTGRPILCLEEAPDSNDAKLLRQFAPERSFFAPLGDAAGIHEVLANLREYLARSPQSALHLPPEFAQFSRAKLAAQLGQHLSAAVQWRK